MPRAVPLSPDARRAALMAATAPLLEVHGRNVSTRQIAEAAGVAEGTIFRVFDSKEGLVDAVVEEAFGVETTCRKLAEIDAGADLEARLVQAVTLLQERQRRVFALFHALALSRDLPGDPARHAKHLRDNKLLDAALAGVVGPDAARLRFTSEDAASLLKALTFAVCHPILSDHRHTEPRQIVDILLHGICAAAPNRKEDSC